MFLVISLPCMYADESHFFAQCCGYVCLVAYVEHFTVGNELVANILNAES